MPIYKNGADIYISAEYGSTEKGNINKVPNPKYQRVVWCDPSAMLASLAFTNSAADKDFPSVAVPDGVLPTGATLVAVYAIIKWRKMVDSSGSANAISAASKTIRVKLSTGAWGTDDIVAITMPNGGWYVAANGVEGGDMIVGTTDVKSEVTDDNCTVNFESNQTNRTDAITVTATSLTLYDVESGLLYIYTL